VTGPDDEAGGRTMPEWFGRVGATGQPNVSATALLPAGVAVAYRVDDAGGSGVVQLGLADRQLRLVGGAVDRAGRRGSRRVAPPAHCGPVWHPLGGAVPS